MAVDHNVQVVKAMYASFTFIHNNGKIVVVVVVVVVAILVLQAAFVQV